MGKGAISSDGGNNQDAYLSLSVTVLAALCRVSEIASSEDMTSMIPLILEVMSTRYDVVLYFLSHYLTNANFPLSLFMIPPILKGTY